MLSKTKVYLGVMSRQICPISVMLMLAFVQIAQAVDMQHVEFEIKEKPDYPAYETNLVRLKLIPRTTDQMAAFLKLGVSPIR